MVVFKYFLIVYVMVVFKLYFFTCCLYSAQWLFLL